jgi:hypothetical protein
MSEPAQQFLGVVEYGITTIKVLSYPHAAPIASLYAVLLLRLRNV